MALQSSILVLTKNVNETAGDPKRSISSAIARTVVRSAGSSVTAKRKTASNHSLTFLVRHA
jgi:hypothetical protein